MVLRRSSDEKRINLCGETVYRVYIDEEWCSKEENKEICEKEIEKARALAERYGLKFEKISLTTTKLREFAERDKVTSPIIHTLDNELIIGELGESVTRLAEKILEVEKMKAKAYEEGKCG